MWIRKAKWDELVDRVAELEKKPPPSEVKVNIGVREEFKSSTYYLAGPDYDFAHHYVTVSEAIRLILSHLKVEYRVTPEKAELVKAK